MHFFRDYEEAGNRRSTSREVDFVAERLDGRVVPIEVEFRKQLQESDLTGLRLFQQRFGDQCGPAVVVTRDRSGWDEARHTLFVPLQDFLLAF